MFLYVLIGLSLLLLSRVASAAPGNAQAGKAVYERLCVSCHGIDGRGGSMQGMLPAPPRDLTQAAYLGRRSDQQLFTVIQQGGSAVSLSPAMPAFGAQLSEADLWNTVAYVRTLAAVAGTQTASAAGENHEPVAGPLTLARLRLSLWPEYDDPRVLVIMHGEFSPPAAFPSTMTLPIPHGAEIVGAGMISEQNALLLHPYQVVPGETVDELVLNLPVPRFFVEFYYTAFTEGTVAKQFTYTTPATYAITTLEVDIQVPLQATDVVIQPPDMARRVDERGFVHYQRLYQNLSKGQAKQLSVAYVRTTDAPSVPKEAPIAAQQPARRQEATDAMRLSHPTIALGILAGVIAVYVGVIVLWRRLRGRRSPMLSPSEHLLGPSPATLESQTMPVDGLGQLAGMSQPQGTHGHHFCSQCGQKLQADDRFCSGCGRALLPG